MRRMILLGVVGLGFVVPASAGAQPPAPVERIAPGIVTGGVAVGGLTVAEATATLRAQLESAALGNIVVLVGASRYRLTASEAKIQFDAARTARRALYAGRERPGVVPGSAPGGAVVGLDVGLVLSHSKLAVASFVGSVQRKSTRAARDATLRITVRKMVVRRARIGRQIDASALEAAINAALVTPREDRTLRSRLVRVYPKTNVNDLRKQYRTVLTADRETFKLRLFKGLRLRKTYGIAVGQAGHGTPGGRFSIANKQVNPAWHVPNSDWAGSLAGTTVPGGAPNNPLKARWLGIADGVGIHGTGEPWSIGSRASHGCLRMKVPDVIDLYPRVPVGTPILIK